MTIEELLSNGYMKCPVTTESDELYQKTVRAGSIKLYFINIEVWDYHKCYPEGYPNKELRMNAEVYFYNDTQEWFQEEDR